MLILPGADAHLAGGPMLILPDLRGGNGPGILGILANGAAETMPGPAGILGILANGAAETMPGPAGILGILANGAAETMPGPAGRPGTLANGAAETMPGPAGILGILANGAAETMPGPAGILGILAKFAGAGMPSMPGGFWQSLPGPLGQCAKYAGGGFWQSLPGPLGQYAKYAKYGGGLLAKLAGATWPVCQVCQVCRGASGKACWGHLASMPSMPGSFWQSLPGPLGQCAKYAGELLAKLAGAIWPVCQVCRGASGKACRGYLASMPSMPGGFWHGRTSLYYRGPAARLKAVHSQQE